MYAYAATQAQIQAQNLLSKINEAILFPLITLMMALALLIFLYGAFEYVRGATSEGDRETGKRHLLWGTIGMLVMLSALSILYIAAGTFDLDDELDSALEDGTENNGFFSIFDDGWGDDPSNWGPSEAYYYSGDDEADADDGESGDPADDASGSDTEGDGDTGSSGIETEDEDPFSDGIEAPFFSFYEDKINDAQQSGTIAQEEVIGFFSLPNGEFPDNYLLYENTELMPWCEYRGGLDVFSISVNNDTSRMFFCVDNL